MQTTNQSITDRSKMRNIKERPPEDVFFEKPFFSLSMKAA